MSDFYLITVLICSSIMVLFEWHANFYHYYQYHFLDYSALSHNTTAVPKECFFSWEFSLACTAS